MVDSSNFSKQAEEYRKQGDKIRNPGWIAKIMSDKEQRASDALDAYRQAANCFKAAGDKSSAVECFLLCAECEAQPHMKANFLNDAAKILKSYDTDRYYKTILEIV